MQPASLTEIFIFNHYRHLVPIRLALQFLPSELWPLVLQVNNLQIIADWSIIHWSLFFTTFFLASVSLYHTMNIFFLSSDVWDINSELCFWKEFCEKKPESQDSNSELWKKNFELWETKSKLWDINSTIKKSTNFERKSRICVF